jgi:hypothetical protein
MSSMNNEVATKKLIKDLPLSEEFIKMAEVNGFASIEAILSFPATSFLNSKGVNYHLYKELVDYLKENDMLHLLNHQC